jgi:hypothetical protein
MKPSFLLLSFALGAATALAQQGTQGSAPDTKPASLSANEHLESQLQRNTAPVKQENVPVTPSLQVGGPLVDSFKPKQPTSTPRRLLNLVNPLAPVEPQPVPETRLGGVSTRAWSSVVGWSPGGSAFPDPVTHEPHMTLVSVSVKNPK